MAGTMNAWKLYAPNDLRPEVVPIPDPGPEEALLQVEIATTCGTDLKMLRRGHPKYPFPLLFGHEVAGVVVAKGEKVTHVKVGDHVATVAGGAFAEYVLVEARMAMREMALIPEGVPLEVAALTEPFACAYHGFVESEIRVGDEVAVLGCGAIGLMFIRLAKMGGARVIATDVNARRLQFARQVGADVVINSGEAVDPAKAVRDQTEGRGVDVAIEAVGLPSTWEQAFGMVRAGGLVTFFGGCEKGTSITLDTQRIHYDEIRMQGVYNYHHPDHFHKAFQLIRQGALDPAVFVTDHASLAETGKVFERLLQGYDGIKFAIHPK